MKHRMSAATLSALSVLVLAGTAHSQATFQPLGFPGGAASSSARSISGDGLTVVGSAGSTVWWWREVTGAAVIPGSADPSKGVGISQNGSVIVYSKGLGSGSNRYFPDTGTIQPLPPGVGTSFPEFGSVSPNGTTFGGAIAVLPHDHHVGLWSQATGYTSVVPGVEDQGLVLAFSTDGSVAVGYGYAFASGTGPAFRWTSTSGYASIGYLSPPTFGFRSAAYDVTPDGAKVVGFSDSATGRRAFVWTAATQMVDVGAASSANTAAYGISDDGSVIVGQAAGLAFVWTQDEGVRNLQAVLAAGGAPGLEAWTLTIARGISSDGSTVVGSGVDPQGTTQAFVARFGTCYANCDGSSVPPVLNPNDFLCFINRFAAGDSFANCDGVGGLSANDFQCFISRFDAGCGV
jgi:probable HAF family extracellular repeat protein